MNFAQHLHVYANVFCLEDLGFLYCSWVAGGQEEDAVHGSDSQVDQQRLSLHDFHVNCQHVVQDWLDEFWVNFDQLIQTLQSCDTRFLVELDQLN